MKNRFDSRYYYYYYGPLSVRRDEAVAGCLNRAIT